MEYGSSLRALTPVHIRTPTSFKINFWESSTYIQVLEVVHCDQNSVYVLSFLRPRPSALLDLTTLTILSDAYKYVPPPVTSPS
jgi:hypothetical protein